MIDVLHFIFGSFWRWAGMVVLIAAFGAALPSLVTIKRVHEDDEE